MLSLILPSYKGAEILDKSIPDVLLHLEKLEIPYELIVVDDGSDDDNQTMLVADKFGAIYIQNESNRGKGFSVKQGVFKAKGDVILFTDIDLPFGVAEISKFYNELKNSDFDVLIGDLTHPDSNYFDKIPASRKKASKLFSTFISFFILSGGYDTQCGLKGFKKKAADSIFNLLSIDRFAFDVEALVIAKKQKLTIKAVPVQFVSSQEGASAGLMKQGMKMLLDLFKIRWKAFTGCYNQ